MAKVIAYDVAAYDSRRLPRVISDALDEFAPDVRGKNILVKPNILGPFAPEKAIVTHPHVVQAIVEELERRGAAVVVGDNPGMRGYGTNLVCAEKAGYVSACGERLINIGKNPVVLEANAYEGKYLVSSEILNADMVITVPKFKTHVLTTITGAIKNSYGFLVGGLKAELHRLVPAPEDFAALLVDVYKTRPPDLCIMDAIVGMEGQGPSGGRPRQIGKIIASDNGVAVDVVMAYMMGLRASTVPMLRVAAKEGLGPSNVEEIDVLGDIAPLEKFKLPFRLARTRIPSAILRIIARLYTRKPVVRKNACVRCGMCARQCPVDAIRMDPYPVIDERVCISCFCCHEYCEHGAITAHPFFRLFH